MHDISRNQVPILYVNAVLPALTPWGAHPLFLSGADMLLIPPDSLGVVAL